MNAAMNARLDLILTELRLPSIKRLALDLCEQSDREVIKAMEMGVIDRVLGVWGPSAAAPSLHAQAWTARGVAASRGNAACQASPIARGAAAGPHSM